MKRILVIFFLVLVGCKSTTVIMNQEDFNKNNAPKSSNDNEIKDSQLKSHLNNFVTSESVKSIVSYLASDELKGRNTGSKGIESAAIFIENQLKKSRISPYFKTYRDSFKLKEIHAYNLVGFIEGNDKDLKREVVIIGAHYDHIGYGKRVEADSIANGANDNAAGTASVLKIAEYFAKTKRNKRSILITLFSAEEKGLLGSKHLAKRLKNQNVDLYTMLNFEMLGVPFIDRPYDAFVTGFEMSNLASKINGYASSSLVGFSEISKKYDLFKHSDNYPFYLEFNVPCQTISSCDLSNYNFYHHVDDEYNKLDYNHMSSLINKLIPAIESICNSPTKEIVLINE